MPSWFRSLRQAQRSIVLAVGALAAALALVVVGIVLTSGDDPDAAASVETQGEDTSSTLRLGRTTTTSSTTSTSTSTTVAPTTTAAAADDGGATATTARRRSSGTGAQQPSPQPDPQPSPQPDPQPSPQPAPQPPPSGPCATGGGAAGQMASLFCDHRAGRGLPSMTRNGALDGMAQEWANKMAADQELSHRSNDEASHMVAQRCACPGWAENVAFNSTVGGAWSDWLASGLHRGNIEDGRDGEYGIGVASSGGYLWFVLVLGYY